MPEFKGINSERLRVPPTYTSAMHVLSWEDTHWQHHIWETMT